VNCPFCDGPLSPVFYRGVGGDEYARCASCGGAALVAGEAAGPQEDYYHHAQNREIHGSPVVRREQSGYWLRWLARAAPPGGGRRLLDLGCGPGSFLAVAAGAGWQPLGCDLDAEVVRRARQQGADARCGRLHELELPSGSLDVVTAWDVLEHLDDLAQTLAEVRRILRPGGRLLAEVPDEGFAGRRVARVVALGSRDGQDARRFFYYPAHRAIPTRRSVRAMLERAQLVCLETGSAGTSPALLAGKAQAFHRQVSPATMALAGRLFRVASRAGLGNKIVFVAQRQD